MEPGPTEPAVRRAEPRDVPDVLRLVRERAEFEGRGEQVRATEADLAGAMFPADGDPTAHALVGDAGGQVVGVAIWYRTYSTFHGRQTMWLEDLFIDPSHRGTGLGEALLVSLAQICVDRGFARLEWTVLNWIEPSIAFYRSLGAQPHAEFMTYRLEGPALRRLGEV